MRTSENAPLRIAELSLGKGLMGLTLCPGKKDEEAMSGPCWRSLEADLHIIKDWGAGIIVTLMEAWELEHLQVPNLGEAVRALGMKWWHLPMKDQSPLESDWEPICYRYSWVGALSRGIQHTWKCVDLWDLDCSLLRHFLHSGGRVLIHCRGGLGRTGTLAARLLMEEGQDAQSAMRMVRDVRPHAIETATQEKYLREWKRGYLRRVADARVDRLTQDRVEGLLTSFLETPWLYMEWKTAMDACCLKPSSFPEWEATANARLREGRDGVAEASRDILSALAYCYGTDRPNVLRAREYFGIQAVPRPQANKSPF